VNPYLAAEKIGDSPIKSDIQLGLQTHLGAASEITDLKTMNPRKFDPNFQETRSDALPHLKQKNLGSKFQPLVASRSDQTVALP